MVGVSTVPRAPSAHRPGAGGALDAAGTKIVAEHICAAAVRRGDRRAVVLGDNSIGRRVARSLTERGVEVALLPLTDDPPVPSAELVVIADDDLGKNLLRVDRIRAKLPHARIVCRAFHEEAAEILTRPPFRCEVLSSSRLALQWLLASGALPLRPGARLRDAGVRAGEDGAPVAPARRHA